MIKKLSSKISAICLLGVLGINCNAPTTSTTDLVEIPENETENSLLWQISGNGLTQPSYLFGTIHIIGKNDFFIGDNAQKALKNSKKLVTEIELKSMSNVNPFSMMLPKDSSLKNLMSTENYQKVKDFYATEMNMEEAVFEMTLSKMKPIVIQQQIGLTVFGEDTKSYEMEFLSLAQKNNIPNIGLETMAYQMEVLFNSIPLSDQVEMLIYTIDSAKQVHNEYTEMIKLYKEQNINELAVLMNKSESGKAIMEHKAAFLTDRNANWIPIIDSLIKEESCFIAVGAAHLPAEGGIIDLLKHKGYTVTPLKND